MHLSASTGKMKTYRIKMRFPAKSNFSMLSLLRAIVINWNERLIVELRLRNLLNL